MEAYEEGRGASKESFKQLCRKAGVDGTDADPCAYKGYLTASPFFYSVGTNMGAWGDFILMRDMYTHSCSVEHQAVIVTLDIIPMDRSFGQRCMPV